jgi:hypothetical protein
MRNLKLLDAYRLTDRDLPKHFRGFDGDETCGAFVVPSPIDKGPIRVIASSDFGWEHVSVSRRNRTPNWTEMSHIKGLFYKDDETVMELHVPKSDHINEHPYCLHLWRPTHQEIPRPPAFMVGGMTPDEAEIEMKNYDPITGILVA